VSFFVRQLESLPRGGVDEHPPIHGYELVELIGRNGHLIYKARRSATGQLVWLNVVHSGGEFGQVVAEGLRQQARILTALNHPNIVRLVEVGEAPGYGFFSALDYVEGTSLALMVRHSKLPHHGEVIRIASQIAAALDYSHGRNVVHGNVHPKHILLDRCAHVFLIGFGELGPRHPEGMLLGNPHFLAPEQFDDLDRTVPQTDIYEMGEIVFLLLTGSFPFQGCEGIEKLLNRKRSVQAPSIRERRPELPGRVDLALQRAMALRPEDRYLSAGQFVEELVSALRVCQGEPKKWWRFRR
jgi:serine/threonine-protein kinase